MLMLTMTRKKLCTRLHHKIYIIPSIALKYINIQYVLVYVCLYGIWMLKCYKIIFRYICVYSSSSVHIYTYYITCATVNNFPHFLFQSSLFNVLRLLFLILLLCIYRRFLSYNCMKIGRNKTILNMYTVNYSQRVYRFIPNKNYT